MSLIGKRVKYTFYTSSFGSYCPPTAKHGKGTILEFKSGTPSGFFASGLADRVVIQDEDSNELCVAEVSNCTVIEK